LEKETIAAVREKGVLKQKTTVGKGRLSRGEGRKRESNNPAQVERPKAQKPPVRTHKNLPP